MSVHEILQPTEQQDGSVPPLENGDRLTADEFLLRYEAMPEGTQAELIEGVVYMLQPVSAGGHGEPHFRLNGLLGLYELETPGVTGGDNSTLKLDLKNVPQPDLYLRIDAECDGQAKLINDYVVGAPELVAEIAASSANYDLHDKLQAYQRNQVQEYIVWRTWDRAIDWFVSRDGTFVTLSPDADGIHRSLVFPGLWLDTAAIIRRDRTRVREVLEQGIASEKHKAFVQELQGRRKAKSGHPRDE